MVVLEGGRVICCFGDWTEAVNVWSVDVGHYRDDYMLDFQESGTADLLIGEIGAFGVHQSLESGTPGCELSTICFVKFEGFSRLAARGQISI